MLQAVYIRIPTHPIFLWPGTEPRTGGRPIICFRKNLIPGIKKIYRQDIIVNISLSNIQEAMYQESLACRQPAASNQSNDSK